MLWVPIAVAGLNIDSHLRALTRSTGTTAAYNICTMSNAERTMSSPDPKPLSPYAPSRPLRHVVSFKCAECSQAKVDALGAALSTLSTAIPELHTIHFGPDMGLREPGYNMDYTITADFSNQMDYLAFTNHPAYVEVVNELIKPLLAPGELIARMQFKIEHTPWGAGARNTLMRADAPLFNVGFGIKNIEAAEGRATPSARTSTVTDEYSLSSRFHEQPSAASPSDPASPERKPLPLSPYAPSRPLRHIVAFKCAEGSQAKVDALDAALSALSTTIALDHSFHFGPDMGLREPGYNMDYTITADFSDETAYQAFCNHPAYVKVVNEMIKPLLAPGEPVARMQFKINHNSRARQSLLRADPPLFNVRFGGKNIDAAKEHSSPSGVEAMLA